MAQQARRRPRRDRIVDSTAPELAERHRWEAMRLHRLSAANYAGLDNILRLKHQAGAGLSHAKIAAALGLSKGVVGKSVSLASAKGIAWPLPDG